MALIFGLWFSVFTYFRLIYILPAFYILVALGISSLDKNIQRVVLILSLIINLSLAGFYLVNPRFHRENWRDLVTYVSSGNGPSRSAVVFVSDSQTEAFRYYDPANEIKVGGPKLIGVGYDTIWLMRYVQPIFDPNDMVRKDIESLGYIKIGEHNFNGVTVWKYMK